MRQQTESHECNGTFFCIPHTHWEGAVFKTREEYLEMGLPHILRALHLLKAHPQYRFTLDQACYVQPFLERHPEEETTFRQFVAEGRLAIVGGTDVMLDVNMPGGESFVRQVLYGKQYFRRKLGIDVTVGWQLDTFGHHAQMPQLLKLAGYQSFWFFRGVASWDVPTEFLWEGLDGSRIPAFWLAQGYSTLYMTPKTLPEFTAFIKQRYEELAPFTTSPDRVGIAAWDVGEPEEHLPVLLEQFNRQADRPCRLQFAVPADFQAAAAKVPDRPVIAGELNPIFQGTYSSRIELKQRTRELETLLTTAEKLGVLLRSQGVAEDDAELWRAWEPLLFNQAHDLMSGVMTDHVYDDTLRGYDFSRRLAEEQVHTRLQEFIARIDTRGEAIPLVVFNTLGWTRTDVAEVTVGFSDPGVRDVRLFDSAGQAVPVQILDAQRYEDGTLVQARIAFVPRDVPALGCATYRLLPQTARATVPQLNEPQDLAMLENEFYRLQLNPVTGAITKLAVKDGNWNALNGPGNVVAMEEDRGDFWELYRRLDGGSRIAMTEPHGPPQPGKAVFSTDQMGEQGQTRRGSVLSELTVSHPFSGKGHFQTTIRLYTGLRRIEIRTKILNHDSNVRYRVLFPTGLKQGESVHEIPFGAIRRPDGIEFPAQNWVDWNNSEKGVALLNRGLPGNNVVHGTMMLSLLRSTRIVGYAYMGGYEAGMGSDSGLELGKELTFDYALVPHVGDWREATLWRDGQEFNNPLIARTATSHSGVLPSRWGFLSISHPYVVVSALKTGEKTGVVLRVYEAAGQATEQVRIRLASHIASAEEVNLMEDRGQTLHVDNDAVQIRLRPFEVKTLRFLLHPGKPDAP
jgi:alpha-mannosidase